MDGKKLTILFLVLSPVFTPIMSVKAKDIALQYNTPLGLLQQAAWKSASREDRREVREPRRAVHYHSKRHMLPEPDSKRRVTTQRPREFRKKPSGHLTPLEEDDIDNDEVISVAIGPPPIRPKYDKVHWKHPPKPVQHNVSNGTASNIVKDVLTQLGREFLSRQVSEDFVFGQYVGNAMRNLTADIKLKMQHDVLELIVRYQRLNRGEIPKMDDRNVSNTMPTLKEMKLDKKFTPANDTEDTWPDFSNLAKIVG